MNAEYYNMKYGGVWKQFHEQITNSNEEIKNLKDELFTLKLEYDKIYEEKNNLLMKFKENISALTTTETSHLESKQIIKIIKNEHDILINKVLALETHIDWLNTQLGQVKSLRNINIEEIEALKTVNTTNEQKIIELQLVNDKILQQNIIKDNEIKKYKKDFILKNDELLVLTHSLSSKDSRIVNLIKEKHLLNEKILELNKLLKTKQTTNTIKYLKDEKSVVICNNNVSLNDNSKKSGIIISPIEKILKHQKSKLLNKSNNNNNSILLEDILDLVNDTKHDTCDNQIFVNKEVLDTSIITNKNMIIQDKNNEINDSYSNVLIDHEECNNNTIANNNNNNFENNDNISNINGNIDNNDLYKYDILTPNITPTKDTEITVEDIHLTPEDPSAICNTVNKYQFNKTNNNTTNNNDTNQNEIQLYKDKEQNYKSAIYLLQEEVRYLHQKLLEQQQNQKNIKTKHKIKA